MCFYADYDWYAQNVENVAGTEGPVTKCDECGEPIPVSAFRRTIHMDEYEECQICEDGDSADYIDREEMQELVDAKDGDEDWAAEHLKRLAEHKHDYGETFDYVRCETCEKVLASIEAHEKAAVCPADAQQPCLGGLWDELAEHGEGAIYIREAVAAHPEIAGHERVVELLKEAEAVPGGEG